jgi:hypothetical protein
MKILLIDVDSKIPNLALMKLSAWHKSQGDKVYLNTCDKPDKVYASAIFTRSKKLCEYILKTYPEAEIGGTGWDIEKKLPEYIEQLDPDYSLYGYKDGMEFSTRGCVRNCEFCFVPRKEGKLCQAKPISRVINGDSKVITLLDNNFTADPMMIDKCGEIRERGLIVDICQGIDIRLMTDKKAQALSTVKHQKQIRFAWDLEKYEKQVTGGIDLIIQYVRPYRLMCYILCGFNTDFSYDMYRFETLRRLKIDPYVMVYNENPDIRLHHFERWVNGHVYSVCKWDEYEPWIRAQEVEGQMMLEGSK